MSKKKGNFLNCLEYLGQFDDFLKSHLEKYQHRGSGHTSYLSHNTYDEFLVLMADRLLKSFVEEVKNAPYFSIIVDSTPDVTHVDQLSVVLRYVKSDGEIVERFFFFKPLLSHKSECLKETVLANIEELGLDIQKCRGQSYDNASNMAGRYSGLQARIKEACPTALYVPCSSHSLNLVGNSAAESCEGASRYFNFVQNIYTFFSTSTHRWQLLVSSLGKTEKMLTVKQICDTRWSARADAVLALEEGYNEIRNTLIHISEDADEKPVVKIQAKCLASKFEQYENAVQTVLWNRILQRINTVSKSLQAADGTLKMAVDVLLSLEPFIQTVRDEFERVEEEALGMSNCIENPYEVNATQQRQRKRKIFFDESQENETIFQGKQKFIVEVFTPICDRLLVQLKEKTEATRGVFNLFSVIFSKPDMKLNSVKENIQQLIKTYSEDIDEKLFEDELLHFWFLVSQEDLTSTANSKYQLSIEMYKMISGNGLRATFPNIETILKIFLTLPIANASAERSFSALKRVKNYLRSRLTQEHLECLSILYIESKALNEVSYEEVINDFVQKKARKKFI